MEHSVLVILSVLAVGLFCVVVPMAVMAFWFYRQPRVLVCPEADREAKVGVDPFHAARTSVLGRLQLKVASCSLWPERGRCGQACLQASAFKA